jgi:hypothetical protein
LLGKHKSMLQLPVKPKAVLAGVAGFSPCLTRARDRVALQNEGTGVKPALNAGTPWPCFQQNGPEGEA